MPFLPMMPGPEIQSPSAMAPPSAPSGGSPDLSAMLGSQRPQTPQGDLSTIAAATSGALRQFDQIEQLILDLTQAFPGNEDVARQMMDGLNRWRQSIAVSMSVPSPLMPGVNTMM